MDWLGVDYPFSPNSLTGKHAIVCGASKGIGAATCQMLALAGAKITAVSRNPEAIIPTLHGSGHQAFSVNLEDQKAIDNFISSIEKCHILVNNSGGPPGGPLLENTMDDFEGPFKRHLHASHSLVKALVPLMEKEGYGRIINIISTSVKEPIPNIGLSNTIRGAMASWSKSLSNELPSCITINNVLPGFTDTDRLESLANSISERTGKGINDIHSNWLSQVPIGRLIDPLETGAAITYLCLPISGSIRGVSLAVDGGRLRSV
ncbi:MAG: SDR family oxidoreductase [Candidatus Poseidoniaceae archaeon]|jgi:3-oxoacyl-[acyl-carrier protein] reductase|nr:SDR family oxidoreductase [Candidatus Poseidoniaceae archaeon]